MINRSFFAPVAIAAVTMSITGTALAMNDNVNTIVKSSPISVWFSNDANKSVSQIGLTGARATVPLKKLTAPITVVNINGVAYVRDATGKAIPIDPVRLVAGPETQLPRVDSQLVGNGGRVYSVDGAGGEVRELDPASLAPRGSSVKVTTGAARLGAAVADANGVLWVANSQTGEVVSVIGPAVSSTQSVAKPNEEVQLSVVNGSVVSVNTSNGTVKVISGSLAGSEAKLTLANPTGVLMPATVNNSTVLPVLTADHSLTLLDIATGTTLVYQFGAPNTRLGIPVLAGIRVYVPDYTNGVLLVVDVVTGNLIQTIPITGGAGEFEVVESGGRVFINDPKSEVAWTIDQQGNVRRTEKYDPNGIGGTAPDISAPPSIPPKSTPSTTAPSTTSPTQPSTSQPESAQPSRPTTTLALTAGTASSTKPQPSVVPNTAVITRPPRVIQLPRTPTTSPVSTTRPVDPTTSIAPTSPPTTVFNPSSSIAITAVQPAGSQPTNPENVPTSVPTTARVNPGDTPTTIGSVPPGVVPTNPGTGTSSSTSTVPRVGPTVDPSTSTSTTTTSTSTTTSRPGSPLPPTVTPTVPPTVTSSSTSTSTTTIPPTVPPTITSTSTSTSTTTTTTTTTTIALGNGAVSGLSAVSSAVGSLTVSWGAPTRWYPVTGYTATLVQTGAKIDLTATQFAYTFTGLDSGQTYSVQVSAKSANGNGIATESAGVLMVGVPSAPGRLNIVINGTSVTLTWGLATANGSPITGYAISGSPAPIADVGPAGASITVNSLIVGQTYTFGVRALSAAGPGPVAATAVTIPSGAPTAPTGVAAVADDARVTVSWSAATANTTTISGYTVRGSDGATATVNGTTLTATLTAVNGTAVTYTVVAMGSNGLDSPASASSAAVTPSGAPTAPDIALTATANTVTVGFAYPVASNGTTVASVVVSINGVASPVEVAPYVATGLTPGTLYNVVLRVTGANGKISSKTGSVTTTSPPPAVTGLTYSQPQNGRSANLSWTASAGATSYRVTVDGTVAGTVSTTTLRINAIPGTPMAVTVTPIDAAGLEGPSTSITVVTENLVEPPPICPRGQICNIP